MKNRMPIAHRKKNTLLLTNESKLKRIALTEFEKKEIAIALEMLDKGNKISYRDFLKKVS